ncbi:MAG: hypothetical protein CVU56_19965 [Deltaproteobacteria bacterium HGW-Deltaproteobacteria-14]|nr:MAG: hypothetical protein CVU56_19965 [Deltaproteobacteria bacterium HGW-Deltaproteobacteria-14]
MTFVARAVAVLGSLLVFAGHAVAAAPGDGGEKRPSLSGQTKTKSHDKPKASTTERSFLASIDDQKTIIQLTPRSDPKYPVQVIALADFYWDLAEWYGLQAYSEEIEKPLYEAEQRKDTAAIDKLKAKQKAVLDKKQGYQDKTIQVYKDVIRDFPSSKRLDEVRYFLAYNLTEMGRQVEGVDVYTELIGSHPGSPYVPDAIVNIGEYYFDMNDFSNALKLYRQAEKFEDANIYGYALYKQAWCYYNLGETTLDGERINGYKLAVNQFIRVIKLADEQALTGKKGAIVLKREAQNDMVLPYSKVGRADGAIAFLKTYAPQRYLDLAGKLAEIYTEQNEFLRSTSLLRQLITEAKKGNIAGQDKSYMVVQFERQIVDNAMRSGDKAATVAEIGELLRAFDAVESGGPKEYIDRERDEIKRVVLDVASAYHKEYSQTQERQTLEYTQQLYDQYLQVFKEDENAYQIAMNNALLLLATEKYEEAAAEFEKVIRMKPEGQFADDAAERAVLAYLKLVQIENKALKDEATEDLKETELSGDQQRFVNAIDRWMALILKNGENPQTASNIPTARFAAAKIYYNANHFEEAARRFAEFIDKHPKNKLVNDARRQLLSAYNLAHDVDNLIKYANAYDAIPSLPQDLKEDIQKIRNALNFQACFKDQQSGEHLKAAQCFEQYAAEFPNEDRAAAAIYNAGINYFEAKQVEKALKTQLELYKRYRSNELAPKALYSMGEMFRQTAVYDQAAEIYETFVKNHAKHPLAEKALRLASIYRKTLGNYPEAISNLNLWLARYGDQPNAARVDLDVISILEKQGKASLVVRAVGQHLKRFPDEAAAVRLQAYDKRGLAYRALRKYREANQAFEETVAYFKSLKENELQDLDLDAVSAVAEAHFNLGENQLRQAQRIKLDSPSDTEMAKTITKKIEMMKGAKAIYEQVIAYGHPGWEIAAWSQLGLAYQDLADAVENATVPRKIRHLPEVVDQWKQSMTDRAKTVRESAIAAYKSALEIARRERWFNEYSERAEAALAQLDLTDRSTKEFRLRPTQLEPSSAHPTFLTPGGEQ